MYLYELSAPDTKSYSYSPIGIAAKQHKARILEAMDTVCPQQERRSVDKVQAQRYGAVEDWGAKQRTVHVLGTTMTDPLLFTNIRRALT
jgi:hypothetical protein